MWDSRFLKAAMALAVHAIYWLLLFLSVVWYKERLFGEPVSDLFSVINHESFNIIMGRYVLIFAQWLPLLALKLSMPLDTVLQLYSFGMTLYFYAVFLFAFFFFRNRGVALAVLVITVLTGVYSFFVVPMSELWYGSALLVVVQAMLTEKDLSTVKNKIIFFFIAFLAITSHPVIAGLVLFLLAYNYKGDLSGNKNFYLAILLIELFAFWHLSGYERSQIQTHYLDPEKYDLSVINTTWLSDFINFLFGRYLLVWLMLAPGLWYLWSKGLRRCFVITACSFLILFIILFQRVGILYNDYGVYYIPLFALAAIPFFFHFFSSRTPRTKSIITLLIIAISLFHLNRLSGAAKLFTARVAAFERILEHARELPADKFFISADHLKCKNCFLGHWYSLPIESIVFSSLLYGSDQTVNIAPEDAIGPGVENELNAQHIIAFGNVPYPIHHLNEDYFKVEAGEFYSLNRDAENKRRFFAGVDVALRVPEKVRSTNEVYLLPVSIYNGNETPLYSGETNGIYLSYRWFEEGEDVTQDRVLTPLEVDVYDDYHQFLEVELPEQPGEYELVYDLVRIEGEPGLYYDADSAAEVATWLGCGDTVALTVNNPPLPGFFINELFL